MSAPRPRPDWLDPIIASIGVERELNGLAAQQRDVVRSIRAPIFGALHVTCSDEAQQEAHQAFQRSFVDHLLPSLKFSAKAPFRTVNLAGRYEQGSIPVAEDHFAAGGGDWKVLVVRIDAHVAVTATREGPMYGFMRRYRADSSNYCGALHLLLADPPSPLPAIAELRERFTADGIDRIAMLREAPEQHRLLLAAVCQARLSARQAVLEIQDHTPASPTLYLVIPTVTINRAGHDGGLVVGVHVADHLGPERRDTYVGLGDRPDRYRVQETSHGPQVADDDVGPG